MCCFGGVENPFFLVGSEMNLRSAMRALEFCGIVDRDEFGKPIKVLVPGHEGRQYEVSIDRIPAFEGKRAEFLVECHQKDTEVACLGNSNGHICYHVIAALIKSCEKQGWLTFFEDYESANFVSCFANGLFHVQSGNGSGHLYTLWHRYKPKLRLRAP